MELKALVSVLEKLGYTAIYFDNKEQAKTYVIDMIEENSIIGMGGTVTINQLEIPQALMKKGCEVYHNIYRPDDDPHQTRIQAIDSDYFLCSTNAITENGTLVNIDGLSNRIAAMCYGPKHLVYMVGKNKLTKDIPSAIDRIKKEACPKNAKRLGLNTPCGVIGECRDCNSPQRMCRNTIITERPPRNAKATIVLVGEELGY